MSSRIDWDQLQGHRSSKGCLHAVPYTSNKSSSGEQNRTKAQIPPEGSGVEGAPYTIPSSQFRIRCGSAVRPGGPRPRGALALPATGPASPPAEANPSSGLSLPRQGLQALSAARGRTTCPCSSAPARSRVSSKHSLPSPPLARWWRVHFRRVSSRARPGGCCRCRPTGSTLFAA